MDDFDRTLMRITLGVTLLCIGVVTWWMVGAYRADAQSCQLQLVKGSNILYGKPSVSWFPPGLTCTYNHGAFIDSPRYVRLPVLLVAVIGLPFTWWMRRSLKH